MTKDDAQSFQAAFNLMSAEDQAAFPTLYKQIKDLVMDAGRVVTEHYAVNGQPAQPLDFAKLNDDKTAYNPVFGRTCSTQAVKLSDPPHVLVERLRELKAFALGEQTAR